MCCPVKVWFGKVVLGRGMVSFNFSMGVVMEISCYNCGSIYVIYYKPSVYCHMCGKELYTELIVPKLHNTEPLKKVVKVVYKTVKTKCIICGKKFEAIYKGGRYTQNTCSVECRIEKIRVNAAKYRKQRREKKCNS